MTSARVIKFMAAKQISTWQECFTIGYRQIKKADKLFNEVTVIIDDNLFATNDAWISQITPDLAQMYTAYQQAAKNYERGLTQLPDNSKHTQEKANALYHIGHSLYKRGLFILTLNKEQSISELLNEFSSLDDVRECFNQARKYFLAAQKIYATYSAQDTAAMKEILDELTEKQALLVTVSVPQAEEKTATNPKVRKRKILAEEGTAAKKAKQEEKEEKVNAGNPFAIGLAILKRIHQFLVTLESAEQRLLFLLTDLDRSSSAERHSSRTKIAPISSELAELAQALVLKNELQALSSLSSMLLKLSHTAIIPSSNKISGIIMNCVNFLDEVYVQKTIDPEICLEAGFTLSSLQEGISLLETEATYLLSLATEDIQRLVSTSSSSRPTPAAHVSGASAEQVAAALACLSSLPPRPRAEHSDSKASVRP